MRRLRFLISTEGSINRLQFWLFFVGASVFSIFMLVLAVTVHPLHSQHGRTAFIILLAVSLIVSSWTKIVIFSKRWHDLNRSGWWTLLWFIPLVGPAMVIAWLGFIPGNSSFRRRRHHSRTEASVGAPSSQYRPISKLEH